MTSNITDQIASSINNLTNEADFFPRIINSSKDRLIEIKDESKVFEPLKKATYLNAIGNNPGIMPDHDTDQASYSIKNKASNSYIRQDIITSGENILYYRDDVKKRITVPKYRTTNHAFAIFLEDFLQNQTFNSVGSALDQFEETIRANLISQHSMHVKAKDVALMQAISGQTTYAVNIADGVIGGTNTTINFGLDTRVTDSTPDTMTIETLCKLQANYVSYFLAKPKEPLFGFTLREVFDTIRNEYLSFGSAARMYSAPIRYIPKPDVADEYYELGERIEIGSIILCRLPAYLEKFAVQINQGTPANSILGINFISKRAIAAFHEIKTRQQSNYEMHSNPFKRGMTTELGVFNLMLLSHNANQYFDYMVYYGNSAFTIVPDEFGHAGFFALSPAVPAVVASGASANVIDFTNQISNIVTRVTNDYNNDYGNYIANTQQYNARMEEKLGIKLQTM